MQARFMLLLLLGSCTAGPLRGLANPACQVQVDAIAGSGSIFVDPDQLVITAEIKSRMDVLVGDAATKLKELVASIDGMKYAQSFSQESNWDNKLSKSVNGDWQAVATITVPINATEWKSSGSSAVSGLITKILALRQGALSTPLAAAAAPTKTKSSADAGGYSKVPESGDPYVHVSITSTDFSVSDELRKDTEKKALSLAVTDAIANIEQSAMPFLSLTPEKLKGFGAASLKNVRISTTGGGGFNPTNTPMMRKAAYGAGSAADNGATASSSADGAVDLTYVVPAKQSISQSATVSACVV